jgi:hypothetical protein
MYFEMRKFIQDNLGYLKASGWATKGSGFDSLQWQKFLFS